MFRALSAHLQEDTVVHMQHMVLSLSMRVPGGLSVHSLSQNSLKLCTDRPPGTLIERYWPEKFETLTAITHLLITKYILKLAGICGFCNVNICT